MKPICTWRPARFVIGILVVCALFHILWTIDRYPGRMTAVPLWIHLALVLLLWSVLLVLGFFVCRLISKKKQP